MTAFGENYWTRRSIGRRSLIRSAALGAAGLAGASLIGCGGGDDAPGGSGGATTPGGATGGAASSGQPKAGGTLVWGMESDIDPIDPHTVNAWVTWRVNYQMFETLVAKDLSIYTDGDVHPNVPRLAESFEVGDEGTSYTFKLRQGVKFHDGTDFDAEAVAFNWERWREGNKHYLVRAANRQRYMNKYLEGWEVIDDHTIKFKNSRPFGEFLELQTGYFFPAILSPTALEKMGNDGFPTNPTGTGPFKFVEREEGQRIVAARNEEYWDTKAHLDRIIWRPIPEPVARVTALQTGEAHLIFVPPPDEVPNLKQRGFNVSLGPSPHIWYQSLNMLNPAMRDIRVRKALQMSIDKEGMANNLLSNTVVPAHQMHAPGAPAHDPTFKMYDYDVAEAKKLLSAAGYDNLSTEWWFAAAGSGNILPVQMAEWIQRNLRDVNVDMKITAQEWIAYLGALNDLLKQESTAAYQMSWGMSNNFWLNVVAHSRWRSEEFPGIWYWKYDEENTTKIDAILDQAESSVNPEEANGLYRDANRAVMDAAWMIPIVHDLAPVAMDSRVKGWVQANEQVFDVRGVWLDT
jgi:peptide/nickel transport system substrate-binding protein